MRGRYSVQLLEKPVIAIVGPTASGKSSLAQEISLLIEGEVISADSMQVYRGLDIGTGKLLPTERYVKHYGLDLCDPNESYSAALFQDYARTCFKEIDKRGKRSVLCGGTGFYIRAAIDNYEFPGGEQEHNPTRDKYMKLADENGNLFVWNILDKEDPESARLIHPNNLRRVVRALEMLEEGVNYSVQQQHLQVLPQLIPAYFIGLQVTPEILNSRIEARVDDMIDKGLVQEVERLLQQGFRQSITAPQAIGYKEIVRVLDGEISLDKAVELIKTATRRYAKRQRTWFRKDKRIQWLNADSSDISEVIKQAIKVIVTMDSTIEGA